MKEKCTVFYSWQSDIKQSRNFVSDCLKEMQKMKKDITLVDIDRDTQGIAGSPDIGDSIYNKIDASDIFVADVTIINSDYTGRKTPNPNVMIELGYAIKSLGWDRIILIYNRDYGDVETLPFDINHRRMTGYSLEECCKGDIRRSVATNIGATVDILLFEHRLHGGSPEYVKARETLSKVLKEALKCIWEAFYKEENLDPSDVEEHNYHLIPISEKHIALIEIISDLLSETQYNLLHQLMNDLRGTQKGTHEKSSWQYVKTVIALCFEIHYVEYADKVPFLPFEDVLNKSTIELLNVISIGQPLLYSGDKMFDGKIVFCKSKNHYIVYSAKHEKLYDGEDGDAGFTGFKVTETYSGYYVDGRKNGKGEEFTWSPYFTDQITIVRKGMWRDDIFEKGVIYNVIVEKDNGVYKHVNGATGGIVTPIDFEFDIIMSSDDLDRYDYKFADINYNNGNYSIINGSIKDIPRG